MSITLRERFLAKAMVDLQAPRTVDDAPCWRWTAAKNTPGYGQIRRGRASEPLLFAHRVAWELFNGPIPAGMEIDHLCRVKHCVNPAHLEPVTHSENNRRAVTDITRAKLSAASIGRKKEPMPAEQRKKISDGLKRYFAARRAQEGRSSCP